ncbi:MAG TPA: fluoride efflux transporter CrcB [Propionibacteriaceae bacterium]|nr:fluoride efflux transporter CrcB [Propionibacteriaceae bacterium]
MSGALTAVLICVAGGVGAALRLILDGAIRARTTSSYPVGTTVINVTGSFLLGLITGLATSQLLPLQWQLMIGTGFLGGYTTFSTASFETVRLIEDRRYVAAAFNGLGMLLICTAAAALGIGAALLLVAR